MKEISLHNIKDQQESCYNKKESERRGIALQSKYIAKKKSNNNINQ